MCFVWEGNRVENQNQYQWFWLSTLDGADLKKDSANLEESFCTGGPRLEHDGEDGEDDDLDGGAPRVPVGSADSVLQERIQFQANMFRFMLWSKTVLWQHSKNKVRRETNLLMRCINSFTLESRAVPGGSTQYWVLYKTLPQPFLGKPPKSGGNQ